MAKSVKSPYVFEDLIDKHICRLPWTDDLIMAKLEAKGITQVKEMYKVWLRQCNREKARFDSWLQEMCETLYTQRLADSITAHLEKWDRFFGGKYNKCMENENGNASENGNGSNTNKRHCTENPAQPRDNKNPRPDTAALNSSAEIGLAVTDRTGAVGLGSSGSGVTGSGNTVTGATESGYSGRGATGRTGLTSAPTDADHKEPDPSTQSVELDVTLITEDDQQLNEAQTNAVYRYLEESILKRAKDSNTRAPRFKRVSEENGTLQLSCEDALSLMWLKTTIANAPETVVGTKVTVKTKSDLVKKYKVALNIPYCRNSVDDTLLLLTKQNEWAEINTWSKHSAMENDFLEFWVPKEIVHTILEKGGQLHYKLGSVSAWVTAADTCQLAQRNTRGAQ